jgi:hypothetical protein
MTTIARAILLANRAAALLMLGAYEASIYDCKELHQVHNNNRPSRQQLLLKLDGIL